MHPYLAPPAPTPLKSWRSKQAPRRLVEIDPGTVSDSAAAVVSAARGSLAEKDASFGVFGEPLAASHNVPMTPPGGKRSKARRFLPGEVFEVLEGPRKDPVPPLRSSLEAPQPWSVSPSPEWPQARPLPPRCRGLDPYPAQCHSRRLPWDRGNLPERDRLREDAAPLEAKREFADERQGYLHEIAILRLQCAELKEAMQELQSEPASSRLGACRCQAKTRSLNVIELRTQWRDKMVDVIDNETLVHLRVAFRSWAREAGSSAASAAQASAAAIRAATFRDRQRQRTVASIGQMELRDGHVMLVAWRNYAVSRQLRASSDRLSAVEARNEALLLELRDLQKASIQREEAVRAQIDQAVADAEGRQAAAAEAAADAAAMAEKRHAVALAAAHADAEKGIAETRCVMARRSRDMALGHGHTVARLVDSVAKQTAFSAWRDSISRADLSSRRPWPVEGGRQEKGSLSEGHCAHTVNNLRAQSSLTENMALALASRWAASMDKSLKKAVIASWLTAASQKRVVGAIRAQLFAEEARRSALVNDQRAEGEARLMEVETQQREMVQRTRSELADIETKHSEALAAQEIQFQARLATCEAEVREAASQREDNFQDRMTIALETQRTESEFLLAETETRFHEALRLQQETFKDQYSDLARRYEELLRVLSEISPEQLPLGDSARSFSVSDGESSSP